VLQQAVAGNLRGIQELVCDSVLNNTVIRIKVDCRGGKGRVVWYP
jgi:hypothetical protein